MKNKILFFAIIILLFRVDVFGQNPDGHIFFKLYCGDSIIQLFKDKGNLNPLDSSYSFQLKSARKDFIIKDYFISDNKKERYGRLNSDPTINLLRTFSGLGEFELIIYRKLKKKKCEVMKIKFINGESGHYNLDIPFSSGNYEIDISKEAKLILGKGVTITPKEWQEKLKK